MMRVIMNFRHKGLHDLSLHGRAPGVMAKYVRRLRRRFTVIDAVSKVIDINASGCKLHSLVDERNDIWAISVSGNWCITLESVNGDAYILDYEDYHQ